MSHILEFDSLYLEFGPHTVLKNIYMKCQTAEIVGLLGRNGSGKSCLMRIVFGEMNASYKSVRINGDACAGNYLSRKLINYLPQSSFIPSFLTARQALKLYKISEQELFIAIPAFKDFLNHKPGEMSGGYLRLFEVLLVLKSPTLFSILDEPFSGLMPIHIEALKEIIISEKMNKGIIITDHLHRHITSISDKLYVLTSGQTYQVNDLEQLIVLGYLRSSDN